MGRGQRPAPSTGKRQLLGRALVPGRKWAPCWKAACTVMYTVGVVAASWKLSPGGMGTSSCAGATTLCPMQPGARPKTASPILWLLTPAHEATL